MNRDLWGGVVLLGILGVMLWGWLFGLPVGVRDLLGGDGEPETPDAPSGPRLDD
ncbi:MAG: hypothetical protein P4L84_34925 [Isosphaeraceae bacterium]|nr:hypothetical protein [Isosphaeraceae bacterium]